MAKLLYNVHISPYEQGNIFNHDPVRTRKLLMHKKQIARLAGEVKKYGNNAGSIKGLSKRWVCEGFDRGR